MQQAWDEAKGRSPHFGPSRYRLPGPLGAASHLPGNLPGDQGFDPLALWTRGDAKQRLWLQEAELLHARCAQLLMLSTRAVGHNRVATQHQPVVRHSGTMSDHT